MGKASRRLPPGTREETELPVGFSLVYNSNAGLSGYALQLALHDRHDPALVKAMLYDAYLKLCYGIQPHPAPPAKEPGVKGAVGAALAKADPPVNLDDARLRAGLRAVAEEERKNDPPASELV